MFGQVITAFIMNERKHPEPSSNLKSLFILCTLFTSYVINYIRCQQSTRDKIKEFRFNIL